MPHKKIVARIALAATLAVGLVGIPFSVPAARAAAPTPTQSVYVASFGSVDQPWFDGTTGTWGTITLPAAASAVLVSPDGSRLYYNSWAARSVFVVDAATKAVIATIPLGAATLWLRDGFVLSPDGSSLYVGGDNGIVSRIDTTTFAVGAQQQVDPTYVSGLAISPDGTRLVASAGTQRRVVALDPITLLPTGLTYAATTERPESLAISPDGSRLFVGYDLTGSVALLGYRSFDLVTGAPLGDLSIGQLLGGPSVQGVGDVSVSLDGATVYAMVSSTTGFRVVEIDTATSTVRRTTPINTRSGGSQGATSISTADGKYLYATGGTFGVPADVGVFTLDTAAGTVQPAALVGVSNVFVALTPDQAPVASFTATTAAAATPTQFDASASTSLTGPIARYDWDFGDGTIATTAVPTVSHTYSAAGTFTARLTETTAAGTSTAATTLSNGTGLIRRGGPTATTSNAVTVSAAAVVPSGPSDPATSDPGSGELARTGVDQGIVGAEAILASALLLLGLGASSIRGLTRRPRQARHRA